MPPVPPFAVHERVRWSDCDPLGIIFYGAYIRLFEIAEHEMFRSIGLPFDTLRAIRGVWLPRKAFQVEFAAPAAMDELLTVGVGVQAIGTTSITLRFTATCAADGAPRATATLTVVCVDKPSITKRPVPDWLREALQPMTIPTPPT